MLYHKLITNKIKIVNYYSISISDRLIDDLMAYLRGKTSKLPVNVNPLPNDVKDIFYLMADYNFKNNSWVNFV